MRAGATLRFHAVLHETIDVAGEICTVHVLHEAIGVVGSNMV
jgi:hypothetical protein